MRKTRYALGLLLSAALLAPAMADTTYTGHGASSVAAEVLEKYAPPPLDSSVTRRIETMLDVRGTGSTLLSPDGRRMFFNWRVSGTNQVWRVDGPLRFPVQLTGGEDSTLVQGITPDGKYLLIYRDRKGEENPGLYLQKTDGGPLIEVQHKPNVQTFPQFITPDSRYLYYKANDQKPNAYTLYRYDLTNGAREVVFSEDGLWGLADRSKEGKLLLSKAIGSLAAEFYEYDEKTKQLTPLFGQGENEEYYAKFGAKPGEILVNTPKFGEFRRLYRWQKGQFKPVTPETKWDVAWFDLDESKKRIYTTLNENGYTRLKVYDAATLKEVALPKLPEADHVYFDGATFDGRFASVQIETSRAPRSAYVIDWQTKQLTKWLLPSTPEVDTSSFAPVTLEYYPARDGTKIPMLVRRPKECGAGPCPVVVDFHGGPEGQSQPGFSAYAQMYVDAGFIYVEPNVRGSDGYGKSWLASDDGPKRLEVVTDIEDAAKYIKANWGKNGVAPKVGITGGSYGGYATLAGMTMFAGSYDAGVSIVGISNLLTFLNNTAPYRRILRISEYGDPEKDQEALIKLSPSTYLDRVKAPLLIIQGASDPRVPVGEAIQIHEALQAKNIPSQLIIFADEGHGSQKRSNRVLEIGHTLRFFETHLKPAAAARNP